MIGCFAEVSERLEFRSQTDQEAFDTGCRHLKDSADAMLAWEEDKTKWDALRVAEVAAMQAAAQFEAVASLEGLGKALMNAGGALFRASYNSDPEEPLLRSIEMLERSEAVLESCRDSWLADMARINRAASLTRLAKARNDLSLGEAALKIYQEIDPAALKDIAGFEAAFAESLATVRGFVHPRRAELVVADVERRARSAMAQKTREAFDAALGRCAAAREVVDALGQPLQFAQVLMIEGGIQAAAATPLADSTRMVSASVCYSSAALALAQHGMSHTEWFARAKASYDQIQEILYEFARSFKLDSPPKSGVSDYDKDTYKVQGSKIDSDSPSKLSEVEAGTAFASAVKHAHEAVRDVAARLQERLDQARRFPPSEAADREALVREVDQALALGIEIRVDGKRSTKLKLVNGSPAWRIGSSGTAGFRKHSVEVLAPSSPGSEAPSGHSEDLAEATLEELVATLAEGSNTVPLGLVDRLTELIRAAQAQPPLDRRTFRDQVNSLLDGYSLRFQLEDGTLARLAVASTSKAGTLQFGIPGGGNRGFKKSTFKILPTYMQNNELRAALEN